MSVFLKGRAGERGKKKELLKSKFNLTTRILVSHAAAEILADASAPHGALLRKAWRDTLINFSSANNEQNNQSMKKESAKCLATI